MSPKQVDGSPAVWAGGPTEYIDVGDGALPGDTANDDRAAAITRLLEKARIRRSGRAPEPNKQTDLGGVTVGAAGATDMASTDLVEDVLEVLATNDPTPAAFRRRRKDRPVLTENPNVDIPHMGYPVWLYAAYKALKVADQAHPEYFRVPGLTRKEQALLGAMRETARLGRIMDEEFARQAIELATIAVILELRTAAMNGEVAYLQSKGGGATTTTAVYVSTLLRMIAQYNNYFLDANPASGTGALRFELDNLTITVQDLARRFDEIVTDARRLGEFARPSREGVRVVSAASIIKDRSGVFGTQLAKIVPALKQMGDWLDVDTANEVQGPATTAIVDEVRGLVFTANCASRASLLQLGSTMESLRDANRDKVDTAVVVFSNVPPGATLDDYRQFLDVLDDEDIPNGQHRGPCILIPHDPYLIDDSGLVDTAALRWETLQAYRDVVIAVLLQQILLKTGQPYVATASLQYLVELKDAYVQEFGHEPRSPADENVSQPNPGGDE